MDPVPPRRPKDIPFYEAPDHVQTSAKIISEAKQTLARSELRSIIQTRRPVTPQDSQRKLFGEQSVRDPTNRPPSAFSLGSRHFDADGGRPVSGTRLLPLDHNISETQEDKKPRAVSDVDVVIAPKPPADPNRPVRRSSSRTQRSLQHANSVDVTPTGGETGSPNASVRSRSGSLQDVSSAPGTQLTSPSSSSSVPSSPSAGERRVNSGPKERTQHPLEIAGEGDAKSSKRRSSERAESGYSSDQREGSASSRGGSAGKSGSAGKREEETPEESLFYNTRINPIVDEMATHVKDKDPEKLTVLSEQLYSELENANLLGKQCKRRSAILKMVFRLLDLESPELLLSLARLIFGLRVSGNNLTNMCKLVFKVARDEKHDHHFLKGNTLELLLETLKGADHVASADALVYCVGALKFLSGNTTVLKHLVRLNSLEALTKLLVSINKTNLELGKPSESLGHILVQLTATLRNLADVAQLRPHFLALNIIGELCQAMDVYHMDGDLMLNITRIFSKLTMHLDCCQALSEQTSHFRSFLHLLKIYQRREDLVVRISFILGNLTAKIDQARVRLFQQSKALETLLTVFKYYFESSNKESSQAEEKSENVVPSKTEDVLIKVIRVIANLSINDDIGPVIAASDPCIKTLIKILEHKEIESSEELVLNTIATVNNLSFYSGKNSAIQTRQLDIAKAMLKLLNVDNIEGMAEATRVYGNLSRDKRVRDFLIKHKVGEMMVVMLDSGKREVVFTAVGVLINLMADEDKRHMLRQNNGIKSLLEVLRDFGRSDWQLASMVCQTLWNYSGKITSSNACFGEAETQELTEVLIEFTDEESALDATLNPDFDEEMRDFIRDLWETDFCPVATQLLNRIEAHQSNFEPLEQPT